MYYFCTQVEHFIIGLQRQHGFANDCNIMKGTYTECAVEKLVLIYSSSQEICGVIKQTFNRSSIQ